MTADWLFSIELPSCWFSGCPPGRQGVGCAVRLLVLGLVSLVNYYGESLEEEESGG